MRTGALGAYCVAAVIMICSGPALAQPPEPEAPPPDSLSGGSKPDHFLLYGGFDIWRFGRAGYGGFYAAPEGLDKDGFIVRLFVSDGHERYDLAARQFNTDILRVSLLPGWRVSQGTFELKVFAGAELENRSLADVPSARTSVSHIGVSAAAETWWEPIPALMLASSLSATTNMNGWSTRGAAGWRLSDQFWAGPEILASGDSFNKQVRIGAHLTGLKLAVLEWSAAAGFVHDSFGRSGAYGRISVLTRQ
jgi:hypothetical protein